MCWSQQLMHWDTFNRDNHSTVGGDGECRVDKVQGTFAMPDRKGLKLQ